MIENIDSNSVSSSQLKRKSSLLEEESISKMFSTSLSCISESEFSGTENIVLNVSDGKKEGLAEAPQKKIRMASESGYVSMKLPNGRSTMIEFKNEQIFAYQLHLLIEENTGFAVKSTSMLCNGKILAKSDCIKSGSKISLVFLEFHRSEACISET